jgi:hypothetical protein
MAVEKWERCDPETARHRLASLRLQPIADGDSGDVVSLGGTAKPLRTRDHAALIYWERSELLGTIIPYLIEGLRAGDKVVYVADDLPVETVRAELESAGIDVDGVMKTGQLALTSSRDAFFHGGTHFDVEAAIAGVRTLAAAARAEGYGRVRFSVEMTYLLADVPGIEKGPEFEARANDEVFAQFPFVCICSFNGARDVSGVLADVLETHPILLSNGIPLVNPYFRSASPSAKDGRAGNAGGRGSSERSRQNVMEEQAGGE